MSRTNPSPYNQPWRPRAYRKVPAAVEAAMDAVRSNACVAVAKFILSSEIERGDYRQLGLALVNGELQVPAEPILLDPALGRHARWNVDGRTVVRTDLPKEYRVVEWDGLIFGEYEHHFTKPGMYYKRERRHGQKLQVRVRQLGSELEPSGERVFAVAAEVIGELDTTHPGASSELLFRLNLLQESIGGCHVFPAGYDDDDLLGLIYVGWALLPPELRTTAIMRVLPSVNREAETIRLVERVKHIKDLCPSAQLIAGSEGFQGYFLAKVTEECVIAEHVQPGNAIYVFGGNWKVRTRSSRTHLIQARERDFIRIEHDGEGAWRRQLAQVVHEAIHHPKSGGA